MNESDVRILLLCIVVFSLLVLVITLLFVKIYKQALRLIKVGADDDKIKKEYDKVIANKKKNKAWNIVNIIIEVILVLLMVGMLIFSIYMDAGKNNVVGDTPLLKTVNSSSMSKALPENTYIEENHLVDQVGMDDLILLEKLPSIEDIKLYDVILYESNIDHKMVLHRVVHIYEIGTNGNSEREFIFQGDNVYAPDGQIVRYSDMKGIYRGKKVGGIGSFVRFIHTPAGYLCILLACVVLIGIPIIEAKLVRAKKERLREIGYVE